MSKKKVVKDYTSLVRAIVEKIGGQSNIQSVTHCVTRLRFVLIDEAKADTDGLKGMEGVIDVLKAGGQYQVVIGTHVTQVYGKLLQELGKADTGISDKKEEVEEQKKGISLLLDTISGIFLPIMGSMMGTGILKGLLVLLTATGLMAETSGTYQVLYAAADAFFYFLPLGLAITAAKKFETNQFLAMAIAGAFLYPNLVTLYNEGASIAFLGVPVKMINYGSSVIPAIISVYALSKLEKALKKLMPELIRGIFVPLLCLVIMVPASLVIIGPVTTALGNAVAAGYTFLYSLCPPIAGMILAALWPILVIFGAHWGLIPVVMNNFSNYGYDTLLPVTTGTNFAMAGAALAVCIKTKNRELKQLAGTSTFSALVGGVTEPAIYGVNLKYKRPFYIACVCIGIGGAIVGFAGAQFPSLMSTCVLTLPAIAVLKGGVQMVIAAVIGFVGAFAGTYLFGFNDSML